MLFSQFHGLVVLRVLHGAYLREVYGNMDALEFVAAADN